MMNWLKANRTVVVLSTVSLLVILERFFLDFRYVAVEMEAPRAFMPFTFPYMVFAFLAIGGWIWALLGAVMGSRIALIPLLVFNAINLIFAASTMVILCPLPCQTAQPITNILVIMELAISGAAMAATGMAWWSGRPAPVTNNRPQKG